MVNSWDPLFPFAGLGVPVGLVTAEVPTGFVVVQDKVFVQLFCPEAMVQEEDEGVRVPDIMFAAHMLPFQLYPLRQLN